MRNSVMFKMRKVTLIFFFVLLALPTVPASGNFHSPSSRDDPAGGTLPPSILPIVILQGSDYEMGRQYGTQTASYLGKTREGKWAAALQRFSRAEVLKALRANQHFIKTYTPEWIEYMRGIADGATAAGYPMTYTDILLMNCTLPDPKTSTYPPGAEMDKLPPKRCSVASAWGSATTDGRLIGIDTLDTSEVPFAVVIAAFPDRGNAYLCAADAGEIGDHFLMNDKGLFLGNSGGGGSPRPEDEDYGIGWSCSLPYLVRFSDSAEEARDRILEWKINVPENFHFVDTEGGAYVVEKTSAIQAVRKPGDFSEKDFLFSTNNYLAEKMKVTKEGDFVGAHGGYGAYAAPRNKMIWDMLHNYHGKINIDFAKMILRFPGSPPPFPPEGGWDAMFCRPTNLWTAVALPQNGDKGEAFICTGPAGRILHASTAFDGSTMRPTYQYTAGTHTFCHLRLAAGPKEFVEAAREYADEAIASAYGRLMFLNFSDPGYPELKALYGTAVEEMFEGRDFYNKALLSEGGERLALFARSASLFARSQAHAGEVFEAIVPPPTSPSDLGLRPFGGDWASWETRVGQSR
jgi:hypothetical protein